MAIANSKLLCVADPNKVASPALLANILLSKRNLQPNKATTNFCCVLGIVRRVFFVVAVVDVVAQSFGNQTEEQVPY